MCARLGCCPVGLEDIYFMRFTRLELCGKAHVTINNILLLDTCKPELRPPRSGSIDCTDGVKSFSECKYSCGDGSDLWQSEGKMEAACLRNETSGTFQWNNTETPCCASNATRMSYRCLLLTGESRSSRVYYVAERCPPYTELDLFVVLDSSSSVGIENWNKTLNFVVGVIDDFKISPEDLLVGLIRQVTSRY